MEEGSMFAIEYLLYGAVGLVGLMVLGYLLNRLTNLYHRVPPS